MPAFPPTPLSLLRLFADVTLQRLVIHRLPIVQTFPLHLPLIRLNTRHCRHHVTNDLIGTFLQARHLADRRQAGTMACMSTAEGVLNLSTSHCSVIFCSMICAQKSNNQKKFKTLTHAFICKTHGAGTFLPQYSSALYIKILGMKWVLLSLLSPTCLPHPRLRDAGSGGV